MRTDLDSTLSDALSNEEESDTVEMTPEEAAAAIRSAQATLDAVMSKQGADQPRAGREVAAPGQVAEGALSDPGQLTVMVKEPAEGSPLTHQCRICGRSITRPHPVRFRGLATSQRGFRCESCHNTVCAAHATRVSGFWESLFKQGRFCCVLCLLSTQRRDKSPS